MSRARRGFVFGWLHRGCAAGMLLVYLFATLPVLPSARQMQIWFGVRSAERFPCEDHACGCMSAQECWTHCCCMSAHERLAWAERNGVEVPEYARAGLRAQLAAEDRMMATGQAAHHGHGCPLCDDSEKPSGDGCGVGLGFANVSALGCKGLSSWMIMGVPPAPGFGEWSGLLPAPVVGELRGVARECATSRTLEVAAPPPRCGLGEESVAFLSI